MNSVVYLKLELPVDVNALGERMAKAMASLHRDFSVAPDTLVPIEQVSFFLRIEATYEPPKEIEA